MGITSKFAVTVASAVPIVNVVDAEVLFVTSEPSPVTVQLTNLYPSLGVAVIVVVEPSPTLVAPRVTVPALTGETAEESVCFITVTFLSKATSKTLLLLLPTPVM